ncbi:hypothetical protein N0V93_009844 [Gnomoniopsis smithogilvyi]|uniref:Uncharacterized protein n=1 Tax=Gnomoniopsis smithogilvyi TaxID=1191159 RepID=A0A9W8YIW4_9PEZI|nr:hypothetical protein N0V93_009844 [Gnomoniopsis smithogilvyi]
MFSTGAKRMISATTRVYPPIPPRAMSGHSSFAASRRSLTNVRWVPTIFALVSIGYGISAYRHTQLEKYHSQSIERERMEAERRRRDTVLMDAYGDKSSLEDLEKAMALYESQRGR